MRILNDHESFSNAVSRHLSVSNGMDPPEHTIFREMIEQYFTAEQMRAYEPVCREIAADLMDAALCSVGTNPLSVNAWGFFYMLPLSPLVQPPP